MWDFGEDDQFAAPVCYSIEAEKKRKEVQWKLNGKIEACTN